MAVPVVCAIAKVYPTLDSLACAFVLVFAFSLPRGAGNQFRGMCGVSYLRVGPKISGGGGVALVFCAHDRLEAHRHIFWASPKWIKSTVMLSTGASSQDVRGSPLTRRATICCGLFVLLSGTVNDSAVGDAAQANPVDVVFNFWSVFLVVGDDQRCRSVGGISSEVSRSIAVHEVGSSSVVAGKRHPAIGLFRCDYRAVETRERVRPACSHPRREPFGFSATSLELGGFPKQNDVT